MQMTDGDDTIADAGPTSRCLEKALNSRALDSISPYAGRLSRRCRAKVKTGNRDWLSG